MADPDFLARLPAAKTRAAKRAYKRFAELYARKVTEPAKKVALNVLVWGPDPASTSPVSRKRVDIHKKLIELGHNAMMSETLTGVADATSEKTKEFAQAQLVDVIIALIEGSPGALGEVHDFCNHPVIAPKMYVMVPKAYKSGYSALGAIKLLDDGHGGVFWYKDEELTSCRVLTKAVRRVEARRTMVAIYGNNK